MGGQLLGMMGCAGYGGEVINSDFYGKRSKLRPEFYGNAVKLGLKSMENAVNLSGET